MLLLAQKFVPFQIRLAGYCPLAGQSSLKSSIHARNVVGRQASRSGLTESDREHNPGWATRVCRAAVKEAVGPTTIRSDPL